jgi:hypothetical protein
MNEMPQVAKVKNLVANGDYGSLTLAIELLSTLELDESVWLSLFTKNILNNQLKSRNRETLDLLAQAAATRPDFRKLLLLTLPQKLDWLDQLSQEVAALLAEKDGSVSLNGVKTLSLSATAKLGKSPRTSLMGTSGWCYFTQVSEPC